jgi:hypothetical protein
VAERGEFWEVIPRSYRLEVGPIEWKRKRKRIKKRKKRPKEKKGKNQLKK